MANVISSLQGELNITVVSDFPSDQHDYPTIRDVLQWSNLAIELLFDLDYDFVKEVSSSSARLVYESGEELKFEGYGGSNVILHIIELYSAELDLRVTLAGTVRFRDDSQSISGYWGQLILQRGSSKTLVYGINDISLNGGSINANKIVFKDSSSSLEFSGDWFAEFDFSLDNSHYTETGSVREIVYEQGDFSQQISDISYVWPIFDDSYDNQVEALLQGDDYIRGSSGNDTLFGYNGDDVFFGSEGQDIVDIDTGSNDVKEFRHLKNGGLIIDSDQGFDVLHDIEFLKFRDASFSIKELLLSRKPTYTFQNEAGETSLVSPDVYSGSVPYLEFERIGENIGEVYYGSSNNDFISLMGGDDAADGGLGDDVLDGGTGSNFLIGGGGNDAFFLDGRSGSVTWSTVTDFSSDEVNIWGWLDGVSKVVATDSSAGAEGFKGATFHYDLNNDGIIDTSITFSGLSIDDVPDPQALSVEGNGYLLIA